MSRFQPIGRVARWRYLYTELLAPANIGDVITFEAMAELLDLHPVNDRGKIRSALMRAEREYLEENGRALMAVRDVGYEVADAADHIVLAHRQQRKATKALEQGHRLASQIDLSDVDPNVRNALHSIANGFAMQMEINRRLDVRQKQLDDALTSVSSSQERSWEEIQNMHERLRRLEDQVED